MVSTKASTTCGRASDTKADPSCGAPAHDFAGRPRFCNQLRTELPRARGHSPRIVDDLSLVPPPGARADCSIDQGWYSYTQAEHDVWNTLYERQTKLLSGRACDPFLKGLDALDLHRAGIP